MTEFFSALFDLSFRKFVTPQIAKFVYVIAIIGSGLFALTLMQQGGLMIAAAPVLFLTSIVLVRCLLEVSLAIFQVARYCAEIARRGRTQEDEIRHPEP